jgi:hypothetical protein
MRLRYCGTVVERATVGIGVIAVAIASLSGAAVAAAPGADVPRTSDGHPDFSGIWQALSEADYDLEPHGTRRDAPPGLGVVQGGAIPYLPAALEQRRRNFAARASADPRTKCFTLGTPRGIYYPEPFQILQRPRDVTVLFQFGDSVRTIHTNGTGHPEGHIDFFLGDSRARWEGDTLIVDVTDFNDETWLDRSGNFHSDALHVVERWTYLDANTIQYTATLDDEKVYARPWSLSVLLHRRREPNFQLIENYCYTLDYDEYYPYPTRNPEPGTWNEPGTRNAEPGTQRGGVQ